MSGRRVYRALTLSKSEIEDLEIILLNRDIIVDQKYCWLLQGPTDKKGYSVVSLRGVTHSGHRLSYAAFVQDIPDNVLVCHRCDTPNCINPNHLFLGSDGDNTRDMWSKGRGSLHMAKLSEQQVNEIRQLRSDGMTYIEIAHRFGIKPTAARNAAVGASWRANESNKISYRQRARRMDDAEKETILSLRGTGMTAGAIAEGMNLTESQVQAFLYRSSRTKRT